MDDEGRSTETAAPRQGGGLWAKRQADETEPAGIRVAIVCNRSPRAAKLQ